jgi:tetratricopeptide (TPR) repeat protein
VLFLADSGELAGDAIFKRFAIRGTPTTLVLGGDGAEVDWFVGYSPPPESYQAKLEKILKGEGTFKALQAAYAANPKDVAAVFGLARKWEDRDAAKAQEKYKEVVAIDPEGRAGSYTDEDSWVTAPFTEFARLFLATASLRGRNPAAAPVKAFIAQNPKSRLVKVAYAEMGNYYAGGAPKEEAAEFFSEYTSRFPDDPAAAAMWLARVLRDRGPAEKAVELAGRLRELSAAMPDPRISQMIARAYDLAGEKDRAEAAYGRMFIQGRVDSLASDLAAYVDYWVEKKENLESATAMAETAARLKPGDPYYIRRVAYAYCVAGQEAKALEVYGPAWLEKSGAGSTAQDIRSYATFWLRQGNNLDSALAAAQKTVELEPRTYYMWTTLSDIYAKMGNKPDAIKAAEKAVELADTQSKAGMQKKLEALRGPAPAKK